MRLRDLTGHIWRTQRGLVVLLLLLLAMNLGVYLFNEQFLAPRLAERQAGFLRLQDEVRQLVRHQGGAARTPEQLFVLASQDISRFRQSVPEYREFTALIEELMLLADRAGLGIGQISYGDEQVKGLPLLRSRLDFNVTGDYLQLKKFIFSLEESQRLIIIRQIGLQSADDSGVSLRMSLETFFRAGGGEA